MIVEDLYFDMCPVHNQKVELRLYSFQRKLSVSGMPLSGKTGPATFNPGVNFSNTLKFIGIGTVGRYGSCAVHGHFSE